MSETALNPQLLLFLARAAKVRSAMALGVTETDPHVVALRGAGIDVSARANDTVDPEHLADPVDLLYLAPGTHLERPPGRTLVIAADPTSLPEAGFDPNTEADWTGVRTARGPAPEAPRFALAMAGTMTAAALSELAAITKASKLDRPTAPLPDDAGILLWMLVRARRTRRAWELGGGVGAASIWIASGLRRPGGKLAVIEKDAARHKRARGHLARAGLIDRVDLGLGESGRLLRSMSGSPSLVLLDHDAMDRAEDLLTVLPRCAPGALVAAHGLYEDATTHSRFRALVSTSPDIAHETTLAVGRGLSLSLVAG